MNQVSSITAAFEAGKLPSTQQINGFIDWLNDVGITQVEPSSNTELSSRGRILAGAIRQTLDAYRVLLNNKNGDNIVQEAIWHLTEGDLSVTSEAEANKKQANADIDGLRSSLHTLISILWDSISSEGTSIFHDLLSVIRLSVADAAEVLETQAGKAKDSLRQVDDEVQSGERDTLGRSKQRLDEEKDVAVAWEHGMDTVKGVGTTTIRATQNASATVQEKSEKTSNRFQDALNKISERAKNDEQYKNALDTIFDILQRRLNATLDAAADPNLTLSSFIADTTPEQHIPKAVDLFRTFFERLANQSFDPLVAQFRTATSTVLRDPELKAWFNDSLAFARKILAEPGFTRSDESTQQRKELRVRWRMLLEKNEKWRNTFEQFKVELRKVEAGIRNDQDMVRVRNAQENLSRDVESGLKTAGDEAQAGLQAAMEQATWFWQDLFKVYFPKALSKMKDVPIPRTEYKDPEIEFVLENLDISSFNLLPAHVYIRNIVDMDLTTTDSASGPSRTSIGTLTHIQIQALQLKLNDISFWYCDKSAGPLTASEFTGLMDIKLPEKGIDVDLKVRLIPATVEGPKSRNSLKHFNIVEKAEVTISDDVDINVKESNHTVLTTLFKPVMVSRLREALSRTLSEQLRFVVDWADGVAFDVSKRRQVFEDTGLGGGTSMLAAVWSEVGRLQRESRTERRDIGVRATGTGIIVEQEVVIPGEGDQKSRTFKSEFAMGAEPQVLSGEKRGPLGTGSEKLVDKLERVGNEAGVDVGAVLSKDMDVDVDAVRESSQRAIDEASQRVEGAVKAAKNQVGSFKQSVQRKVKLEEGRPGWQSSAFDV